jgi:hypothetical protein
MFRGASAPCALFLPDAQLLVVFQITPSPLASTDSHFTLLGCAIKCNSYSWTRVQWLKHGQSNKPTTSLEFFSCHGVWGFIIVFAWTHHVSRSGTAWIHCIPLHPTLRSILILSLHIRQSLPSGLPACYKLPVFLRSIQLFPPVLSYTWIT